MFPVLVYAYILGVASGALFMRLTYNRKAIALAEREAAVAADEQWLDDREAILPSPTFGTPERDLDEDGWPLPKTVRAEDVVRKPWRVTATATVGRTEADRDEWAARPVDGAWLRYARAIEHEPLAVRVDRRATAVVDRVAVTSGTLRHLFLAQVGGLRDWLAAHEPSWIEEIPPAPHGRHERTEAIVRPRVVRFVEVEEPETAEPVALTFNMDTREWRIAVDELLAEALCGAGVP